MAVTSVKLTGLCHVFWCRWSSGRSSCWGRRLRRLGRENQDWIAASSGQATEVLMAVQTVQAFTHEGESRRSFSDVTEKSFASALVRIRARALMTVIVIFLIFAGCCRRPVGGRARCAHGRDDDRGPCAVRHLCGDGGRIDRGLVGNLGRIAAGRGRDRTAGRTAWRPRIGWPTPPAQGCLDATGQRRDCL